MATSILPSSTSSYSTLSTYNHKTTAAPGIKLAPLIRQASVVSYERRQGKMWFIIHVDPQQFNNLPTCLKRHPYTIARRYDDCVQFCQRLHDAFPSLNSNNKKNNNNNGRPMQPLSLPKLKPQGLLNKKQPNGQRRAELDRFVQALFRLPAAITQTLIVLEFFGLQKGDTEQQVLRDKQNLVRQQQAIINSTTIQPFDEDYSFFDSPFNTTWMDPAVVSTDDASKWSSKFKSFRGRSPSSNSLSSFCSQAAHRLPWTSSSSSTTSLHGSHSSSMSSLLSPTKKKTSFADDLSSSPLPPPPGLMSCSSSTSSTSSSSSSSSSSSAPGRRRRSSTRTSQSSCVLSNSESSPSAVRTMKLKVIYDMDNIVVIQIPRSTNLAALRTRLHDKFSTMLDPSLKPLADQFVLLYNENTRSSSSELSLDHHQPQPLRSSPTSTSPSVTLISSERHWAKAMKNWDAIEKVTLRCIH
ncbi:hypothetical protein BCR42DRAFT_411693 [Absidia repens]|uniref:PX domain-containing protein n=1 Tax=Absidia repens TaxID=90262 RepID=A0A1X2IM37_9FUNG|nr:hypothetical protein BCR42DRAFT_411693 [Absidia repens]